MVSKGSYRNVVGPLVQRHRTARGWSQQLLAARCQLAGWDVSRSIVAAIEGRVRWVGDWEVILLAEILGVQIADLYPAEFNAVEFGVPVPLEYPDGSARPKIDGSLAAED
jgi:transcriptional regulator with XRE-family HTH domain